MNSCMTIQRSLQPGPVRLESVQGTRYRSRDGQTYLDLSGQTLNLPYGQPPATIRDAVIDTIQRGEVFYSSRFGSAGFDLLAQKLIEKAPKNISRVNHKLSNGTDAVETALKIAYQTQRSHRVLVVRHAWHGESMSTLPLSHRNRSSFVGADASHVSFSRSSELESLLELARFVRRPSTVLLDPIGFSGGLHRPDSLGSQLRELSTICRDRGHVLIFDEIQCYGGFLGTGYFSHHIFAATCDIIAIGKALGQGFPIAACLYASHLPELLYNEAEFTYGGQPPACSAAIAGLDYTDANKAAIASASSRWKQFTAALTDRFSDYEVRSIGFFCAIRFRDTHAATRFYQHMMRSGIITRKVRGGTVVAFKASILFSHEEFDTATAALLGYNPDPECLATRIRTKASTKRVDAISAEADLIARCFPNIELISRQSELRATMAEELSELGIPVKDEQEGATDCDIGHGVHQTFAEAVAQADHGESRQILVQLVDWLCRAHANGHVLGGRHPNNSHWDGTKLSFSQFSTGYSDDRREAACFEHLFALLFHAASLREESQIEEILMPFLYEFVDVWGNRLAYETYCRFCDYFFHAGHDTPASVNQCALGQKITRILKQAKPKLFEESI